MLLLLRYFFTFRGATLVTGATSAHCLRCDAETLEVVIAALGDNLDVDGNGAVQPLADALMFLRYAFGFRGSTLIANAIGAGCTRCDAMAIEQFLDPLFP